MRTRNARSALAWMKLSLSGLGLTRIGPALSLSLVLSLVAIPPAFAQKAPSEGDVLDATARAQYQADLQQVRQNKAGYAADIVARWENEARASGKWDPNYAVDLFGALMKLGPDNLLAAGEATSYDAMTAVLMAGSRAPLDLGDSFRDLVYTPVTPCRVVDTRNISNPLVAGVTRTFDVDNPTSFSFQGGFNGPCGIPFGAAAAVAMNLTVTAPTAGGFLTAFGLGAPPFASILNFGAGETIANSSIVPVVPGPGNDFSLFLGSAPGATVHAIVDVLGFFAAPLTTALYNNVVVTTTNVAGGLGSFSVRSPACPAGWRLTGGGGLVDQFSGNPLIGSRPVAGTSNGVVSGVNVADRWLCQGNTLGNIAVDIDCFAVCGRVPGR